MTAAKACRLALQEAQRRCPDVDADQLDDEVDSILSEWSAEAAHDREVFGEPDDTPCLESGRDNCDDYGTGEGRYHGRM